MNIPRTMKLFCVKSDLLWSWINMLKTIKLYHSHIHEYAKCTWDVHNIYTYIHAYIEHRNPPLISYDTYPRPPQASESQPSSSGAGLNSTDFFKIPKSSVRFRCVTSTSLCNPVSHLGLLWHLWVKRPLCARAWTPVLILHLSNPCTEPKGSQLN